MAEKTGLEPNVFHSGRKTMIQTLTNSEIPATDIIQLSVWQIIQWSKKKQQATEKNRSSYKYGI